jgi:hypothetical protein
MKIIKLLLTIMFLSFAWVTVGIPATAVTGSGSIIDGVINGPNSTTANAIISIPDTTIGINSNVNVPVNASSLTNAGSISIKIKYDSSVLTYNGFTNVVSGSSNWSVNANPTTGIITIGWYSPDAVTAINVTSGKLLDLQFSFKEGGSNLSFITAESQITDLLNVTIPTTFVNGSVTAPRQVALGVVSTLNVNDTVKVPLTIKNISNIGAISLKFTYDQSVATYLGLQNDSVGFTAGATNGTIGLGWNSADAKPLKVSSGQLTNLLFVYKGGVSPLAFTTALCEIADTALKTISNVKYVNGSISKNISFALGNVPGVVNNDVLVPIKVTNVSKIGSLSLVLNYDSNSLVFKEIRNFSGDASQLSSNAAAGVLKIGYANVNPVSLVNNKLLDVVFTYKTSAIAHVNFVSAQSEVTDTNLTKITGITYIDGSVYPNSKPAFVTVLKDTTINENQLLNFVYKAVDVDPSDTVKYSLSGAPTGATINATTGAFAWTPTYAQSGVYTIKVLASDSYQADTTSATVTVKNVYRAPVFTAVFRTKTICADSTYSFQYKGNSPDGKAVYFLIVKAPTGLSINANTGLMTWKPTQSQVGAQTIMIGLTDSTSTTVDTSNISVYTGVIVVPGIPTVYSLNQNYPNPFNPSTVINYSIPRASNVSVKVFNIIGQEVATLVNQYQIAGNYSVNFNASKLTSGIYLYKISADKFSSVKKMMLVK